MGLLQLWIPEQYGGPGGDLTTVCIAKEEIAKGGSLAASTLCANNSVGLVLPLLHFGTEAQKERYLTEAAKGRTIAAVAMTEPQAGSDVASMRTTAKRDGDSWVINGQKNWITWGANATYTLVFARTSGDKGHTGISAFLVDTKTKGYNVGRAEEKLGRHGAPTCSLFFEDMRIEADCMIGEEGQGFKACMRIMDLNRPTVAASTAASSTRTPRTFTWTARCWAWRTSRVSSLSASTRPRGVRSTIWSSSPLPRTAALPSSPATSSRSASRIDSTRHRALRRNLAKDFTFRFLQRDFP